MWSQCGVLVTILKRYYYHAVICNFMLQTVIFSQTTNLTHGSSDSPPFIQHLCVKRIGLPDYTNCLKLNFYKEIRIKVNSYKNAKLVTYHFNKNKEIVFKVPRFY